VLSYSQCMQMYCTGGIRCDVYSTVLRQRGFQNVFSLAGGVQNYLDSEGYGLALDGSSALCDASTARPRGQQWVGSLYVFDERMAVAPGRMSGAADPEEVSALSAAEPCALCGASACLPHENCSNVDCNKLFLACSACKEALQGCCCETCRDEAPRLLRPLREGMHLCNLDRLWLVVIRAAFKRACN
jgi:predicted sulfurtransferase